MGLVPSANKLSLEEMCWWGWGRSRNSCSPLGEQWSGFDPLSLPLSMRGRRGKCTLAMLLLLPENRLQWEPASVAPISGSAWVDSGGYLQLELKLNRLEIPNSFIRLISQLGGGKGVGIFYLNKWARGAQAAQDTGVSELTRTHYNPDICSLTS